MKTRTRSFVAAVLAVVGSIPFIPSGEAAQAAFPTRPIRIIQGFSAGGVSDVLARLVGDKAGERLGQPIVVEGRPGGGGIVGMTSVLDATPDGYTLLLANTAITISPNRKEKLAFDPMAALAAITIMTVPYKGSGPSLIAAIGNETPLSYSPLLPAIPHVTQGRLKALGMSGVKRSAALPQVPTIAELLPGYEAVGFFGIAASSKVPPRIVERLHQAFNAAVALPDVQAQLTKLGMEAEVMTRKDFADFIVRDAKRWKDLVREANLAL